MSLVFVRTRGKGRALTHSCEFVLLICVVNTYRIFRFVALSKYEIAPIASKSIACIDEQTTAREKTVDTSSTSIGMQGVLDICRHATNDRPDGNAKLRAPTLIDRHGI